jgi:TPP-dependent pyruvate/acetoin dehydrogenase alpha subunit
MRLISELAEGSPHMSALIADLGTDYRAMYRIRRFEETLAQLVQSGEISGSVHLCVGQEAIPVGACRALLPDDPVIATYRGHGWALARGVPLDAAFAEILGRNSDLNGGRAGSLNLAAPQYGFYGENAIVGAGVPIALGLGLAAKVHGEDRVAIVSIGDGAMNQGVVHETLNMGSVLSVPLVLVVENNGYVEMTPSGVLTAVPAAERAKAYRVPSWEVDGDDVDAVANLVADARELAVDDNTPVVIEAHTHRLLGHYSGDAQTYRPRGEIEAWRAAEPLTRVPADDATAARLAQIRFEVDTEVQAALDAARQVEFPSTNDVMRHIYAD